MRGWRAVFAATVVLGVALPLLPAVAAAPTKSVKVVAPAGATARVVLKTFLPLSQARNSIDILGASAGDVAGAALVGRSSWGVSVSTLKVGCRFSGPCTELPQGTIHGSEDDGDVSGLGPGVYDLIVLGRPGTKVSLRLRNALVGQPLNFGRQARSRVTEIQQRYPSTTDHMPEAYFDEHLTEPSGRHVTVLIGHLEAGRPKSLQYSSCLRTGAVPVVHIPRYGSGCLGGAGDELGGGTGAVSVGGSDCSTVPPPVCLPITTESFHLSLAHAQVFDAPAHVSLTADILALQSNVRATALTFAVA